MRKINLILVVSLLAACSQPQKLPSDITANPEKHDLETVAIMGINDFHGSLTPRTLKTREAPGFEPMEYTRGGAALLSSYVRILRSQFKDRFLLLDAGDEFQGSIESNLQEGAPVVSFFNLLKLNAAALGNHEFDFGPVGSDTTDVLGALKERMLQAQYPYVTANTIEKSSGKFPPFPNTYPSILLKAGKLKIGVIGLITRDTPVTTRAEYVQDLVFTDLKEATLREASSLRNQGAEIVIAVAHVGLKCQLGRAHPASTFRKESDPLGECNPKDELVVLLNALPPGTLDAVVSGHSHQIIHHWVRGVPVIQGGAYNQYFNIIYLTYDWTQKKLLRDRTRIEGPVPVCPKIFEHQGDCNGEIAPPKQGRGNLITPRFHGVRVEADSSIEDFLNPILERTKIEKNRILGFAERPISHVRTHESELGNLFADILREKVNADVSIINPGGIRAPFEQGVITFETLFRSVPFDNAISLLTLTGKELKLLVQIAENGIRGIFPFSGMCIKLIGLDQEAPSVDLNKDHKTEPWEVNRVVSIKLADGSPISDKKLYKVATVDFLVTGGDDMGWIMSQIPQDRIQLNAGGLARDAIENSILKSGHLNSFERPLVDPKNPRVQFVKSKFERNKKRKN